MRRRCDDIPSASEPWLGNRRVCWNADGGPEMAKRRLVVDGILLIPVHIPIEREHRFRLIVNTGCA